LEQAGECLASAIAKIGVDAVMTLLTKKVTDKIGKNAVKKQDENSVDNIYNTDATKQINENAHGNSNIGIETENAPVQTTAIQLEENFKFKNPTGNWSREIGVNHYKTGKIIKQMSRSEIGRKVVDANNKDDIDLTLSVRTDVPNEIKGRSSDNNGTAYVYNTESYDETVLTLIHEGLHAMGIRDSRRAEALVRLAELDHQGIPINRKTIRQVLKDMKDVEVYDDMPWRVGKESPHFPGVEF
jgi:hypothetical protein